MSLHYCFHFPSRLLAVAFVFSAALPPFLWICLSEKRSARFYCIAAPIAVGLTYFGVADLFEFIVASRKEFGEQFVQSPFFLEHVWFISKWSTLTFFISSVGVMIVRGILYLFTEAQEAMQ